MITFALRLMKKEELVRSEPELDDVDGEDVGGRHHSPCFFGMHTVGDRPAFRFVRWKGSCFVQEIV